tara:strand:- start:305 stop:484 length:180 start_codon:yes stop_codon:yes gene_type:complete
MSNRRALRISNGSVLYKRDLIRFGKKKKKKKTRQELLEERGRQFNPLKYYRDAYGDKLA